MKQSAGVLAWRERKTAPRGYPPGVLVATLLTRISRVLRSEVPAGERWRFGLFIPPRREAHA